MWGQRRRRWADVLQMLYKCFVFAYLPVDIKDGAINQCRFNVASELETMGQH